MPRQWEDRSGLEKALAKLVGSQVQVVITDNRRSLISVRCERRSYVVRLHHMFLSADKGMLDSLAAFILKRSWEAKRALKKFIRENQEKIKIAEERVIKRRVKLVTQGRYFSLDECFLKLKQSYFNSDSLDCEITWGIRRKSPGMRKVKLGSYSPKDKIIRINPVLDRPFVPLYVLETVVYHEMVHHVIGMQNRNGRVLSHHQAFRNKERSFPAWKKTKIWIEENLSRLLNPK